MFGKSNLIYCKFILIFGHFILIFLEFNLEPDNLNSMSEKLILFQLCWTMMIHVKILVNFVYFLQFDLIYGSRERMLQAIFCNFTFLQF